jgi:hypothetical protein
MEFEVVNIRNNVTITMLASLAGLFLPYLIALLNSPKMSPQVRGLIAMVVYGVTGVVVAWWQGSLDNVTDIASGVVAAFLAGTIKYQFIDKPSLIAPKLEYTTSKRPFELYAEDQLARNPKPLVVETQSGQEHMYKPV